MQKYQTLSLSDTSSWWNYGSFLLVNFISRVQQDFYADAAALWKVQLQVKTFKIWFCFWKCSIYTKGKENAALSLTEVPKYCIQLIHKEKDHNTDFKYNTDKTIIAVFVSIKGNSTI